MWQVGAGWCLSGASVVPRWCLGGVWLELLESIHCFYYDLGMDKFTADFIKAKIDEAVQQNPGVRALNISIEGKFYTYMISYDSVDRTVSGVIMQRGHKRRPISLSDILTK